LFDTEIYHKYSKELAKDSYNPLSIADEKKLLCKFMHGDEHAFNKLVTSHLRFVIYVLKGFKIPENMDVMDLIQAGNYGLSVGIRKFDISKFSCRVATYCAYWIRFYIRECLHQLSNVDMVEFCDDNLYDVYHVDKELLESISEDIIEHTFAPLTSKEKLVIKYMYGFDASQKSRTLKEIGSILNFSIEGIRLLKNSALEKLNVDTIKEFVS
jgi:RNA polymerase sigma factor (sigma-70 family)